MKHKRVISVLALLVFASATIVGCDSEEEDLVFVSSVTPSSGPAEGGTAVTIGGSGFEPGATVEFDDDPATDVVVVNDTTITATTPPHDPGFAEVTVTNLNGQAGTLVFGFSYE